ncbi:MBL fold metallo-hydrolase [Winogradskyella endarachnes]|uniref:MBL fold metallo-hydrolase n=1 Tax=Winogradskyella endarachnes TaxID=2681965 RepID=A0A6L6U8U0_9FLAO|nr:MBL fold metallo-hydrolase [Winogradskyella endarachnes]MUU78449.1 MBL fold metallo-hydrolase [Winogradskyella endarachnes]
MKLTVLTENCAGSEFLAEHGLSYLIEHEGENFLFDVGHTDVFIKNAKTLGIDIKNEVDKIVLSHGHWDHGDGLQYIENKTLITHPEAFIKRFRNSDFSSLGLQLSKTEIEQKFNLICSTEPYYITDRIIFLGQIPRLNDFESITTNFSDELRQPDFVNDDSAVVIIQNNEIIIITGCSHSGICNIIDYASKLTGINTVKSVIGGFHLKHNDLQTQKTIEFLKEKNINDIHPSHCTQFPAMVAFSEHFKIEQLKTGMVLNL